MWYSGGLASEALLHFLPILKVSSTFALKCAFSHVNRASMLIPIELFSKAETTNIASEFSDFSMNGSHMFEQMVLTFEFVGTQFAFEATTIVVYGAQMFEQV